MWLEDCDVDLDYHLRRVQVPAPGGRRELDQVIGEIASTPLDREPPAVGVPLRRGHGRRPIRADRQGAPRPGRRGRVGEPAGPTHGLDGPGAGRARQRHDLRPPSTAELLRAAGARPRPAGRRVARRDRRRARRGDAGCGGGPGSAARQPDLAKHVRTRRRRSSTTWSLRRGLSRRRRCRWLEVKADRQTARITFNDVVLAMAAGGLRELLLRYDGRADRPIIASVPASTDRSPHRITGNEISGMAVRCRCTSTIRWSGCD